MSTTKEKTLIHYETMRNWVRTQPETDKPNPQKME
jgi:hypothetical protein